MIVFHNLLKYIEAYNHHISITYIDVETFYFIDKC